MKLALITSRYPKENQPYNHMFVHVRALYYVSQGIDVTVIVPANSKLEYSYQGVKVVEDKSSNCVKMLGSFDLLYLHLLNQYPLPNGGFKIYNAILKNKYPTALYIHGSDVLVYPEYLYDFSWTLKAIVKYLYVNVWNHILMNRFLNGISKTDKYLMLTPSKWMKQHTEKIFNRTYSNFTNVANGIDTELFDVRFNYENRFKLLTIRPLSDPKYGVDMSIEFMRFLPDEYTLDIYGKGALKEEYELLIKHYNLEHRVTIIDDFIERKELPNLFSKYGIFLAFTLFDSQGVIMCEAMASRLLTISNSNSAISEFVDDNIGGLVGSDLKLLAERLQILIAQDTLMRELVEKGRESMEKINWKTQGQKELDLLKKTM